MLEPAHLDRDRVEQLAPVILAELQLGVAQAVGRRPDRRQRRAQVMADGAQHGRLDRVRLPQRLGLEGAHRQPLTVDGDGKQRRQCGQQALASRQVRLAALDQLQRAHPPSACSQLDRRRVRRLRPVAVPSTIDADRAWRTAATRSPIQSIRPATSPPCSSEVAISASSAVSASRCSASVARRRARAASSLTTTAVTTYTASANQLRESSSVNVCTGGRGRRS